MMKNFSDVMEQELLALAIALEEEDGHVTASSTSTARSSATTSR
jgi:hypothetical protein